MLAPQLVRKPQPLLLPPSTIPFLNTLDAIRETNKIRRIEVRDIRESLTLKNPVFRINLTYILNVLREGKCTDLHTRMHDMLAWWMQTVHACTESDWLFEGNRARTRFSRCSISILFKQQCLPTSKELLRDKIKHALSELNVTNYPENLSKLLVQPISQSISCLSFGSSMPVWTLDYRSQPTNVVSDAIGEYWMARKSLASFRTVWDCRLELMKEISEKDKH